MYGGFVVPPDDNGAQLGVLFWAQDGFSTGCGHGSMALSTWAVETGLVPLDPSGVTSVDVDVPSGRVRARVHSAEDRVTHVDFVNVPSFVIDREVFLTCSWGQVDVDIVFGGALYAHVDAASMGLRVIPESVPNLIDAGREIKQLVNEKGLAAHPADPWIDELYGVIFFERLGEDENGDLVQRNVVVYGNGQIDRSPCGSGTSSRLAVLSETGELAAGQRLIHSSIMGSTFTGKVQERIRKYERDAVIPVVTGSAHCIGSSIFSVDAHDALAPGFVL